MYRLLLFTTLLFFLYCDKQSKDKWNLTKPEFKHGKSYNYSEYISGTTDSAGQQSQTIKTGKEEIKEPLPSFTSESISNGTEPEKKSSGFFSFLFKGANSKRKKETQETICEEILEINKIVVMEQNQKLNTLTNEKKELSDQVNKLKKELQENVHQDQNHVRNLESEIIRLNKLIKILSSELK